MTEITSKQLHEQTGTMLDQVKAGQRMRVIRNGRPAALLIPVDEEIDPTWDEIMTEVWAAQSGPGPTVPNPILIERRKRQMRLVYADSSVLFAYFYPKDEFSLVVTDAVRQEGADFVYWPFLRFEVRHNLRLARVDRNGEIAWRALRASEKTATRLRWQGDLTADKMLDAAEELSGEKARFMDCGSSDYLHVAAARRSNLLSGPNEFWTCDAAQSELARSIGLKTRLFKLKASGGGLGSME